MFHFHVLASRNPYLRMVLSIIRRGGASHPGTSRIVPAPCEYHKQNRYLYHGRVVNCMDPVFFLSCPSITCYLSTSVSCPFIDVSKVGQRRPVPKSLVRQRQSPAAACPFSCRPLRTVTVTLSQNAKAEGVFSSGGAPSPFPFPTLVQSDFSVLIYTCTHLEHKLQSLLFSWGREGASQVHHEKVIS